MARDYIVEILERNSRLRSNNTRWQQVKNRLLAIEKSVRMLDFIADVDDHFYYNKYQVLVEAKPQIESDYYFEGILIGNQDLGNKLENYFAELKILYQDTYEELICYIPIGLVACIEGYFRLVYANLIDYGVSKPHLPFFQNAALLLDFCSKIIRKRK